jgi:hypothetical protein
MVETVMQHDAIGSVGQLRQPLLPAVLGSLDEA